MGDVGGEAYVERLCTPGILVVAEKSLVDRRVGWMRVVWKSGEDAREAVATGARKRGAAVSKDLRKVVAVKDMSERRATRAVI